MKTGNLLTSIMIVFAVIALQSCEPKLGKSDKVRSIGNTSEVLVVLQNDKQKGGKIGLEIKKLIGSEQYGLMQNEPLFDVAFITANNFSDMFKKHRNILIVNINKDAKSTTVESYTDKWSKPQKLIRITSASTIDFVNDFQGFVEGIINDYSDAERKRIQSVFRPSSKNEVLKKVRQTFNLDITIPQGFYVAKTESGFMWIRKEVTDYSQGIIIISEPYIDKKQFSENSIVARTNRDLKQYIPGESEGTYMAITGDFIIPQWKQIEDFTSEYAIEMRGVWNVEHDFMGGPYVSYTFVDPGNNQIVTIMGYVFHPNKKKRNLLRQLEAIIYSVKFKNL